MSFFYWYVFPSLCTTFCCCNFTNVPNVELIKALYSILFYSIQHTRIQHCTSVWGHNHLLWFITKMWHASTKWRICDNRWNHCLQENPTAFFPFPYFSTCCLCSVCTRKVRLNHQFELYKKPQLWWAACHWDFNRQEVSFASFPLDKCHAWRLQFSLTATSVFVVVVVVSLLTYVTRWWWAKWRTRDNGKPFTHVTPTDGGSARATAPQWGIFHSSQPVIHTMCIYIFSLMVRKRVTLGQQPPAAIKQQWGGGWEENISTEWESTRPRCPCWSNKNFAVTIFSLYWACIQRTFAQIQQQTAKLHIGP